MSSTNDISVALLYIIIIIIIFICMVRLSRMNRRRHCTALRGIFQKAA